MQGKQRKQSDFSSKAVQARRQWSGFFKVQEEKDKPGFLTWQNHPSKIKAKRMYFQINEG